MNLGKEILGTIASVAPTLGTALGGPLGGLAGNLLATELGKLGIKNDPASITKAVMSQDPATMLAIKAADNAMVEHMRQMDIDEEALKFKDTESARLRQVAVKDYTPSVLAYLITFGFFSCLGWLLVSGKPQQGGDVMLVMLGALGSAFGGVVGYYFGSSAQSASKTETIATLAKK